MPYDITNILPGEINNRIKFLVAFICGLYSGIYILLFQPFGFSSTEAPQNTSNILIYSVITTVVIALGFIIFSLFDKFIEKFSHRMIKNAALVLFCILIISLSYWVFNKYNGMADLFQQNFLAVLTDILIMSVLPVVLVLFLTERIVLLKHMKTAGIISEEISHINRPDKSFSPPVVLVAEGKNSTLSLYPGDLLCIQGSDNYSTVYYLKDNKTFREMLRVTLKSVEDQLSGFGDVMRCHKSFIVNIRKIAKVSGNAQGYKLKIEGLDFEIPVSRGFPKSVLLKIKSMGK